MKMHIYLGIVCILMYGQLVDLLSLRLEWQFDSITL